MDMSMYWSPSLLLRTKDAEHREQRTHYYVVKGDGYLKKVTLHVFPKGFRYIMGDNNDRTQISVRIERRGTV
jgi:hypothetical protein